ncbi:nucleotide sugar dehydrogenase [Phytohabitans suffuscus]|uniref:UDP-N-acetyl-D-glucosamine dehydrogenase n=1 Tax=Phytohabitans suffuscus TaxID=624315 RepID=A0A6F8YCL2_9ACTN|nr:nucleotide sugar dehydrogenase [Phytohabitans suffuscus]BCB83836.1 UDP-N-acetyl-D-glucosamine dehydrogenase [Phytohabitans suffuscus]
MTDETVVVVGQGYVGLPLAMRAVEVGYRVVGLDTDARRAARLGAASSYVEDVDSAVLSAALASGRYRPSVDYRDAAGFDYAVITVPTPLADGTPDLQHVERSVAALAPLVSTGATVILESTTYPGTTEEIVLPLLEAGSGLRAGHDFLLGYSPERIDPGNRQWSFANTPKVVSGIDAQSCEKVQRFYDTLVDKTIPVRGTREAEMTKLLENTFRHVNVALVNELAIAGHRLGVDVWEAIDAASTKPFGYLRFTPGPGVGGHCLPIDPSYLSWEVKRSLGTSFRFVELANDINNQMPHYVTDRLTQALNRRGKAVRGARVLLLGLAYKKNSSDCRESPAVRVAERLAWLGADISAVDPNVDPEQAPPFVSLVPLDAARVRAADIVVLLTDHDGVDYQLLDEAPLVFDTRHRLPAGRNVEVL